MGEVQDTLNDLISICRDSEKDFVRSSEGVNSDHLRRRFAEIARQRAGFADELSAYVKKIGGEPVAGRNGGNRQKTGRRAGVGSQNDDASIVAECQSSEEDTLRQYERALSKDLPVPVRPIIDRHRLAVQETLLDLRSLELVRRAG